MFKARGEAESVQPRIAGDDLDLVDGILANRFNSGTLSESRWVDLAWRQPRGVVCGAESVPSLGRNAAPTVALLALGLALAGYFSLLRTRA